MRKVRARIFEHPLRTQASVDGAAVAPDLPQQDVGARVGVPVQIGMLEKINGPGRVALCKQAVRARDIFPRIARPGLRGAEGEHACSEQDEEQGEPRHAKNIGRGGRDRSPRFACWRNENGAETFVPACAFGVDSPARSCEPRLSKLSHQMFNGLPIDLPCFREVMI
jgi:hypothetical protein